MLSEIRVRNGVLLQKCGVVTGLDRPGLAAPVPSSLPPDKISKCLDNNTPDRDFSQEERVHSLITQLLHVTQ